MYLFLLNKSGLILSSGRDLSYFSRNVHSMVISESELLASSQERLLQVYNRNAEIQIQGFNDIEEARERVSKLLTHFKLEIPMAKRNQNETTNAEAGATTTETAPKADKSRTPKSAVIRVKAEKNPKREGSAAHKRFALYTDGQTVDDFLKAGGTMGDINFDVGKGFIALEGVEQPAAETAPPEAAAQ